MSIWIEGHLHTWLSSKMSWENQVMTQDRAKYDWTPERSRNSATCMEGA
jgi:hypothetical protein